MNEVNGLRSLLAEDKEMPVDTRLEPINLVEELLKEYDVIGV